MANKKNNSANPILAAVTGVVVGVGATLAGVMALKDKKNLKAVTGLFNNVKDTKKKKN